MSEQNNQLLYALTPTLGRASKSVAATRYSAQMKSEGTMGDAEFQEAPARSRSGEGEIVRLIEVAMGGWAQARPALRLGIKSIGPVKVG